MYFSETYHICSTEMSFLSKAELLMGCVCADSLVHIWTLKWPSTPIAGVADVNS